ncbi:MAG: zinc-ribbon domain-containing protein [Kiritimatiellae bacterium]|nr:zinc-ribbon domain-containing protein [Kiritimatiellia bacterium]
MFKRRNKRNPNESFPCPHCGARVPGGARACPQCGADENTGWSEDPDQPAAGIPAGYGQDEDFDYDEFIAREFDGKRGKGRGLPLVYVVVAVVLLLAVLALWVL